MAWNNVWEQVFSSQEWGKYPGEDVIRFVARNFYNLKDSAILYNEVFSLWNQYLEVYNLVYHLVKYEDVVSSLLTMETFCLPLNSFPNCIVPSFSAIIALSLGFLASNNSATRGNPPVISLVLDEPFGNRAKTSPAETCWPSLTDKI